MREKNDPSSICAMTAVNADETIPNKRSGETFLGFLFTILKVENVN